MLSPRALRSRHGLGQYGQNGYFGAILVKSMAAKDAKNAFGMLIDLARSEPVTIEKHGRKVVVVMAIEEFERLKALDARIQNSKAVEKERN